MTIQTPISITNRWPASRPDVLQLYSFPTPNGVKVSIALEELGLPYEAHRVTLADSDVKSPEFLSLNPNNKIPAIVDPDGPDGKPLPLFESGAILIYLAEKTGRLIGSTPAEKYRIIQWVMFQMGGVGPMFGQLGFFVKFAGRGRAGPDPARALHRRGEAAACGAGRELAHREWIAGEYSIADIAIAPWLRTLDFYGAREMVGWDGFPHVRAYLDRFLARPAVQRGLSIPAREG